MTFQKTKATKNRVQTRKHILDYDSLYDYLREAPNPSEDDRKRDYAIKVVQVPVSYTPIIRYIMRDPTIYTPSIKWLTINISKRGLSILEDRLRNSREDVFELYDRAVIKESDHGLKARYVYGRDVLTCDQRACNQYFFPGKSVKSWIDDNADVLGFYYYPLAVYVFYLGLSDFVSTEKYINQGMLEVRINGNDLLRKRVKELKDFIEVYGVGELDLGA
ncbi:hypothetical protein [Methanosarcina siciliae]|nr:hypothetical protein [Methanosarcina siciliae]